MSDRQMAAMMVADDSYAAARPITAGGQSPRALRDKVPFCRLIRAAPAKAFWPKRCQTRRRRAHELPLYHDQSAYYARRRRGGGAGRRRGAQAESDCLFKGDIDLDKLKECIARVGTEHIPFNPSGGGDNLIGGQPFSLRKPEGDLGHRARRGHPGLFSTRA